MDLESELEKITIERSSSGELLFAYQGDSCYLLSEKDGEDAFPCIEEGEAYDKEMNQVHYEAAIELGREIPERFLEIVLAYEICEAKLGKFGYSRAHEFAMMYEQAYAEKFCPEIAEEFYEWVSKKREE